MNADRQTQILAIDPQAIDLVLVQRAAEVLRRGGLVAFPTETVYGLGAAALQPDAVGRIFEAKGRPQSNPLIVHVASVDAARALVTHWPDAAARLAERFWPGPLTMVLPRASCVPDVVTAGGPTVALRLPSHPVARALLDALHDPVAAPSANRSSRISPTRGEHVIRDLDGRVDLILDAGPAPGGIESTVVDLTDSPVRLLRPGLITPELLRSVVGEVQIDPAAHREGVERSPGRHGRHYAPRARVECLERGAGERIGRLASAGLRVAALIRRAEPAVVDVVCACEVLPSDPAGYAAGLYAALHDIDAAGPDVIVIELPPDEEAWLAVRDRLLRAARTD